MNKRFIKTQLKGVTVHGTKDVGTRTVDLLMGEHSGEYVRGDIMDANAVTQAFDELKGDVDENHDTLEKLETAITAKLDAGEYAVLNSDDANEDSSLCFSSKVDGDSRIEITSTGIESLNGDSNSVYTTDGGRAILPYMTFSTSTLALTHTVNIPTYPMMYVRFVVTVLSGSVVPTYSVNGTLHDMDSYGSSTYVGGHSVWKEECALSVEFDGEHNAMILCTYEPSTPKLS